MRSPGFTSVPVSTGICVICPEDFDFTSTTLIGSTAPVADASTMMSRRSIAAVGMGTVDAFFPLQATTPRVTAAMPATMSCARRFNGVSLEGRSRLGGCQCTGGGTSGSDVLPSQCFDLGLRDAGVEPRLDQRAPRLV